MIFTAERIKAFRLLLGLTQQGFADRIDASIQSVQDWEQGLHLPGRRAKKDLVKAGYDG